ncbi:sensor histidine kinase [Thermoactinospora rubra]|uniref:sensor histidine kinase n=1 Tax=Thermoactinospora rubra TaxID=1088767 RepID=UPI001F0A068F|nr:sensor histidine kinase [Thermoactinospora rubra]
MQTRTIVTIAIVVAVVVGTVLSAALRAHEPVNVLDFALPAVACAALFLRHRYPVAALVVITAATLVYYPYARLDGPMIILPIVALYTAADRGYLLAAIVTGGTALLLMGLGEISSSQRHIDDTSFLIVAEGVVATIAAGGVTRNRRAYRAEMEHAKEEEAKRRETEERLRIARELHDVIGHNISMINVQAGSALHGIRKRPEEAEAALRTIKDTSKETLRQLRTTLGMLRQVDEHAPTAPAGSLARLDELVRESGLKVVTTVSGPLTDLPAEVDIAATRIIREALTNVARHSGADHAALTVGRDGEDLVVRVEDSGPGATFTDGTGFGIQGMRERATALGGSLEAGPRPEGGFRVVARLPLVSAR